MGRLRGGLFFYTIGSSNPTSIITILLLKHQQRNSRQVLLNSIQIKRLRILNNARSKKYSKQVVFDAMLLLLLQKSVIDIDDD